MKPEDKTARLTLMMAIALTAAGGRHSAGQQADEPTRTTNAYAASSWILPEIVVTASRFPRDSLSEPSTAYRLDAAESTSQGARRTTANVLDGIPSVMGQKTSYAQTSPYLRGFTGYLTLCTIDGIRLNHSAFRSGPNQYWNTVDPLSIDHYELVMGPGSVLYGSDAVGGVLNALTAVPPDWNGEPAWERRLYYRASAAERSHVGRAQVGGRISERIGFVGGYSLKSFGDLRGGRQVGTQTHTGYDERDFDAKVVHLLDEDSTFTLVHQTVRQDDAWRTHRTVYGIDWQGLARGADKVDSYDQARDLSYMRYRTGGGDGLVTGMEITLSRHAHGEDRYRVASDDTTQRQGFRIETWGGALQLESDGSLGKWVYGLDYYRDIADSYSRQYHAGGEWQTVGVQGPIADDATYDLAGLFAQNTLSFFDGGLDVIPGIRGSYAAANANRVEDPATGAPTSFSGDWRSLVGSLRMLAPVAPDRRHAFYGGVSQGFRAPNLSDLTRFDIARTSEIEIPAPNPDPEQYVTYEVGFRSRLERLVSRIGCYYTSIDGMIVRTPTGAIRNGLTEVTKMNSGNGYVQGVEVSETYRFAPQCSLWLAGSWQAGRLDAYPTASAADKQRDHMSRLMPPTAQIGARLQTPSEAYWIELVADMAADADKLSAEDRRDTQRIPAAGTPGYAVGTVRAGMRVAGRLALTLAVENVSNEDYRIHGSGVNEAGRNAILTVHGTF